MWLVFTIIKLFEKIAKINFMELSVVELID